MFESVTHPTFRQLLPGTRAIYSVPQFQRDYAWTRDQWDDLWRDLEALSAAFSGGDNSARHYMGYLVMRTQPPRCPGEENLLLIDGQQRMATLTMLMLACAEEFGRLTKAGVDERENAGRERDVRRDFVGPEDLVTLRPVRRLFLNRNDDRFFSEFVLQSNDPGRSLFQRKRSSRLLWEALNFFRAKLREGGRSGEDVARIVNAAGDGLFFTAMRVSNDLNAYQVFETLNARGMALSQGDLVKNLLFQKAEDRERTEQMNWLWEDMESEVGGMEMVDFLRCLWNSRREFVRSEELYRRLRDEIPDTRAAFDFVADAQRRTNDYRLLQDPLAWRENKDARDSVDALTFAFGSRQHLPLLLAAMDPDNANDEGRRVDFFKLLELAEIFHFRRAVVSKASSAEMEIVYNRAALALRDAHQGNGLEKIYEVLADADVTEEQFRSDFARAEFDAGPDNLASSRVVRHILGKLERKMGGPADLQRATIEHILPRRAGAEWNEIFPPNTRDFFFRRLGNYCLLSEKENQSADSRPYAEKRFIYANSAYRTASECEEKHPEWTPAALEERQRRMADLASEIWRL